LAKQNYRDSADKLLSDLAAEQASAVNYLLETSTSFSTSWARQHNLSEETRQEAMSEALLIMIRKVQNGLFVTGAARPDVYFNEIFKRVAANYQRRDLRFKSDNLDDSHLQLSNELTYTDSYSETLDLAIGLVNQLGEPCSTLIKLRFLYSLSDEEVLSRGLTRYTTGDSLRNRRSQCLKALKELWRNTTKV
jgi:hypothetical protein